MMRWFDVVTGDVDDAMIGLAWCGLESSVPLTVVFILGSDRAAFRVDNGVYAVFHLDASRPVGLGWFSGLMWKSPLWQFDDNSFRWRIEFHLLIRGRFEKSSEKRLKHKVVKLILIYFIINNAFYKDEHITHSYECYSNKQWIKNMQLRLACNHISIKQKPFFNGKDHLKILLFQRGINPSLALMDHRLLEVLFSFYDCTLAYSLLSWNEWPEKVWLKNWRVKGHKSDRRCVLLSATPGKVTLRD